MKLCDYGCGQEAHFQLKNGKWCCSKHWNSCPQLKKKIVKGVKNLLQLEKEMLKKFGIICQTKQRNVGIGIKV